jgi:hypothetical protein
MDYYEIRVQQKHIHNYRPQTPDTNEPPIATQDSAGGTEATEATEATSVSCGGRC